jgi:hypothetical protein
MWDVWNGKIAFELISTEALLFHITCLMFHNTCLLDVWIVCVISLPQIPKLPPVDKSILAGNKANAKGCVTPPLPLNLTFVCVASISYGSPTKAQQGNESKHGRTKAQTVKRKHK